MKIFMFISTLAATAIASASTAFSASGTVAGIQPPVNRIVAAPSSDREQGPVTRQAPARNTEAGGWVTLIDENFSKMTAGTEESHDETQLADENYLIDESYFSTSGWTGFGVYQAGGSCAIDYPAYGGLLNTPEMEMKGLVRVSARYKSLNDVRSFTIVLCSGGIGMPVQLAPEASVRLFMEDGWETAVYEFYNPSDDNAFVQFNTQYYTADAKGFLIDDLKVEVLPEYIPPVSEVAAGEFTTGAFKARWTPSGLTDTYLVSLYADTPTGVAEEKYSDDFSSWTADAEGHLTSVPEGYTVSTRDFHPTLVDCGGGNALAFGRHEEYVEFPSSGGKITSFKAKFVNRLSDNPKVWGTQACVEGWDGTGWTSVMEFSTRDIADGEAFALDLGEWEDTPPGEYQMEPNQFRGLYSRLRLVMGSANYGAMLLLDEYEMETRPSSEIRCVLADSPVTGTSTSFNDLDPELDYFVGVKAATDEYVSEETLTDAWGIATPEALQAEDVKDDSFLARWQPVSHASAYLVSTFSALVAVEPMKEYVVLHDDFSGISVGTNDFANPVNLGDREELFPLDDYTSRPGWYGAGATAVDGWLGVASCKFFPGMYGLQLPLISLYSATGDYTVKMYVRGNADSSITVMSTTSQGTSEIFPEAGEYEIEIPMKGGTSHEQLILLSTDGAPFFIGSIDIVQDYEAGEAALTLVKSFEVMGNESSYMVRGMAEETGRQRAYDVMAGRIDFTRNAVSGYSAPVIVGSPDGIADIEDSEGMTAVVHGDCLVLSLSAPAPVEVYNTEGMLMASLGCVAGANDFTLPGNGLYIVRNLSTGRTIKVMM